MRRAFLVLLACSCVVLDCGAQDPTERQIAEAVARAARARAAGNNDEAKREVMAASAAAGDVVARLRVFAASLVDQGFPELSAQVCTQTIPRAPDDPVLRGIHGVALLKMRRYVESTSELGIATAKQPQVLRWWLELARAHLQANQEAAARAAIDRAAALAPDDVSVLEVVAECEYRTMRVAECEATCRKLLAKQRSNPMGWQLLIRCRRVQGRAAEALSSAEEAIKVVGRNPDVVLELGIALLGVDRASDAVVALREAAEARPQDARPHLHLCKAYAKIGNAVEAAASKKRYLELAKDLPKAQSRRTE